MAYALYHRTIARERGILRTSDGIFIREDAESPLWQEYLAWLAEGNLPTPLPVGKVIGSLSDPDAVKESPWQKATSSPTATATKLLPSPPEPPSRKDPDDSSSKSPPAD